MKKPFILQSYSLRFFSIFMALLLPTFFIGQYLLTPEDAAATREPTGSAVFAPPPNIEEVRAEVEVFADLVYKEESGSLLDIYVPEDREDSLPVILWIHGGGFVGGSKDSRRDYAMSLANEGFVVANMDYTLAPEQLYPGPVFQANAALNYLQEQASVFNGDMDRVFIGGDSAGAQIASQLSAVLSNSRLASRMNIQPAIDSANIRGALLFCGLYNMETVRATGFPNIDYFLNTYTGTVAFEAFEDIQELSTVRHITSDFPDSFISAGDADLLASQSAELASILRHKGVQVDTMFFDGTKKNLPHEFQYALDTLDAQETFNKTVEFLILKSR